MIVLPSNRSSFKARILKFEDGLYEVKFKASGELQCCDEVELKRIVRASPRTSPKAPLRRDVVPEAPPRRDAASLDDEDTPPASMAPTPVLIPSPLTWQISAIDEVSTLFADEYDTEVLFK